jgi:hypothetical protein
VLLATALLAAPASARPAARVASDRSAPAAWSFVDFGCANPANRLSQNLLAAVHLRVAQGVTCFGTVRTAAGDAGPLASSGPTGLGPADIRSAYNLSGSTSGGRTVAVVDAYDDPNAESDLAVYRSTYGLSACTTANGCFRKVNQSGAASPLPSADAGWAEEISLDLDAVSAACPDCRILLVEANSANTSDLMAAEDTAARTAGVVAVSNSWGGTEDGTITAEDQHFAHPGVSITASSGDSGYGVSWPASSPNVTAVGGTTLTKASNARGWTETAWSGSGSGCSTYEPKPSWQAVTTGCGAFRAVADVAADADPASGLAVYDTYNTCNLPSFLSALCGVLASLGMVQGATGWIQVGGTSLASPLIASVYALAGNGPAVGYPYSHTAGLFDVTSGSNGACSPAPARLCTAGSGWDGPTGLGTPNGVGAF